MTDPREDALLVAANTDRELWRETPGDYYANSIHVTQTGGIGIAVGGSVIVKTLADWHALASPAQPEQGEVEQGVTQADRDAAADWLNSRGLDWRDIASIRDGEMDDHLLVQAFAAHRRASEAGRR